MEVRPGELDPPSPLLKYKLPQISPSMQQPPPAPNQHPLGLLESSINCWLLIVVSQNPKSCAACSHSSCESIQSTPSISSQRPLYTFGCAHNHKLSQKEGRNLTLEIKNVSNTLDCNGTNAHTSGNKSLELTLNHYNCPVYKLLLNAGFGNRFFTLRISREIFGVLNYHP